MTSAATVRHGTPDAPLQLRSVPRPSTALLAYARFLDELVLRAAEVTRRARAR